MKGSVGILTVFQFAKECKKDNFSPTMINIDKDYKIFTNLHEKIGKREIFK